MRAWVLGSGSRGNAVLLECGDTRLLIDAGFPARVLAQRLASIGVAPQSIEACVVTHEHGDHAQGAGAAATKWNWALFATAGTAAGCPTLLDADVRTIEAGTTFAIGRFDVRTIPTSHDAAEPIAVVATARPTGARAAVCYDLGRVTDPVRRALRDVDVLVLESNHDEEMLRTGPYPPSVCDRIAGPRGHLSNRAATRLACDVAHRALGHVVLAHLSEQCNDRDLAVRSAGAALASTRFRGQVSAAAQDAACGPFSPVASRCVPLSEQLGLGL